MDVMIHYDMRDVDERLGDVAYLRGVPQEIRDWFEAMLKQANSAYEIQRRYEREMNLRLQAENDATYYRETCERMGAVVDGR